MDEEENFSLEQLKNYDYRVLQRLAKSFELPSNVKKVYLIQLIHIKHYGSDTELANIIQKVRLERQQLGQIKRKSTRKSNLQGREISSTSNLSPPITVTPRCQKQTSLQYSPELCKYLKFNNTTTSMRDKNYAPSKSIQKIRTIKSDRVLRNRSLNFKTYKNNNIGVFNINESIIGVVKAGDPVETAQKKQMQVVPEPKDVRSVSTMFVIRNRPKFPLYIENNENKAVIPDSISIQSSSQAKKRQCSIDGIYPLVTQENDKKISCEYIKCIGIRGRDGKITTIKAFVQKQNQNDQSDRTQNVDVCEKAKKTSLEYVHKDSGAEMPRYTDASQYLLAQPTKNDPNYPNMYSLSEESFRNEKAIEYVMETPIAIGRQSTNESAKASNTMGEYSVYYHKKIRAEQVRSRRMSRYLENEEQLPNINDVFSRFNNIQRSQVTQPLYVQVSEESERIFNYPSYVSKQAVNSSMLETLYNLKNLVTSQPLLKVATVANTKCVYSTPVIASAVAQPSSFGTNQYFHNYMNTCNSTIEPQDVGATVTIPDMVEDAMEIISQDGDYMERISMDIRVQCFMCTWAGSKIVLESHIRKEHHLEIHRNDSPSWNVSMTVQSLLHSQLWMCRVCERKGTIYVLCAKCEGDNIMCGVYTLSMSPEQHEGSITIYNKQTGKPFTWLGNISQLTSNLPYTNEDVCLNVGMADLDLIPNSANLNLINKELGPESLNNVINGQPNLDDIHVIFFVRFYDC